MAAGPEITNGKTEFVTRFLANNHDATWKSVNEAWKAAGNTDQISESLVYKLRAKQGLTGKKPATKIQVKVKASALPKAKVKAATKATAAKAKDAAAPTSQPKASESTAAVAPKPSAARTKKARAPKVAAQPKTAAPAAKHSASQAKLVDAVETGIDELIFNLKTNGGIPEVEAALRAARRLLLTRQHGE